MTPAQTPSPGRGARAGVGLAWLALTTGGVCGAAALLAGPAYRFHVLPLAAGLQAMRWAATGALVGGGLALLALLMLALSGRHRLLLAATAFVLNAAVATPPLLMYNRVQSLPRIHDISTDTTDPPAFVAVIPLRQGARNAVDYKPETAAEQKRGYPDITALVLEDAPAQAFERAERAARSMGWEIVASTPDSLRIEATATSWLFGFKDDVVIRIRPQAQGSRVDVRSLSRVGGSDFGVNAQRIRDFLHKLASA